MYSFPYVAHVDNEVFLSQALDRLGSNAITKDQEPDIGKSNFSALFCFLF